jgi:hypothetical protein
MKNNYKIFANEIANEMSGNASRADVKHEIDRRWKTENINRRIIKNFIIVWMFGK